MDARVDSLPAQNAMWEPHGARCGKQGKLANPLGVVMIAAVMMALITTLASAAGFGLVTAAFTGWIGGAVMTLTLLAAYHLE